MKNLFFAALAALTLSVTAGPSFAASTLAATQLQQTGTYGGDGN